MSPIHAALPLSPLASTEGERHAEFRRRKDKFVYKKVPAGTPLPAAEEGWSVANKMKRLTRLSKPKSAQVEFIDKIWQFFYRIGYDELPKGNSFSISYKDAAGSTSTKHIDIFAKDAETVIIGLCETSNSFMERPLTKEIEEFSELRKRLADAVRHHYGRHFKPKILWFLFTEKVVWSATDARAAEINQIHIMTEREIEYFSQLAEHLGRAARYQFLAEFLGGQKIPELAGMKVPAIRGKLGGKTFYSFVSTPEKLMKICFVNHRTLADPLALPTYQRLVKRSRLRAIGEFIKNGGVFPTNILINFNEKRPFDKKDVDQNSDVQLGNLSLPDRYKSAWIVDGQHRLYGYSVIDPSYSKQNISVIAFEGLKREEEANLFVTINHEQKSVPRTLLDELDADLKWGSSKAAERLASIGARIVQSLSETVSGPLFRRVIAQGMKGDDQICLTMPELKGGIVRSQLIGRLGLKRKDLIDGPLSADTDEQSVKRAASGINSFLQYIKETNPQRWDSGRKGAICTNVGVRALLLLYSALIKHLCKSDANFKPRSLSPERIADKASEAAGPLLEFLRRVDDVEFSTRFAGRYGSGASTEYCFELSQIIWESNDTFSPDGLKEHLLSKDEKRTGEAEKSLKFIESRIGEIITYHYKLLYGEKFWTYMGTPEMRVNAYKRQQDDPPEKQLDLDAYLTLVDKKKIIEKSEHWEELKKYFDIPLTGEKGGGRHLKWLDRMNELRRVVAHPHKRAFKPDDIDFLSWLNKEFQSRLLKFNLPVAR